MRLKGETYMVYSVCLFRLSIRFLVAELLWPQRPEARTFRPGISNDVAYVVFYGEYLGVLTGLPGMGSYQKSPLLTQATAFFLPRTGVTS